MFLHMRMHLAFPPAAWAGRERQAWARALPGSALASALVWALAGAGAWPTQAAAQTAPLNDTGQTLCDDGIQLVACTVANAGDDAAYPGQDGRFGRDAAQTVDELPAKIGGGAAGFDFTALDAVGMPHNGTGGPGGHACVKDNVTGLTWEVKQTGATTDATTATAKLRHVSYTYTWRKSSDSHPGDVGSDTCNSTLPGNRCNTQAYVAAINSAQLCGKSDWRLPTRRELLSIVHHGTRHPAIDGTYFPDAHEIQPLASTVGIGGIWWTSDVYGLNRVGAWSVFFDEGAATTYHKAQPRSLRLVRSGP